MGEGPNSEEKPNITNRQTTRKKNTEKKTDRKEKRNTQKRKHTEKHTEKKTHRKTQKRKHRESTYRVGLGRVRGALVRLGALREARTAMDGNFGELSEA